MVCKHLKCQIIFISIIAIFQYISAADSSWYLPIKLHDRQSLENVKLTQIGPFGLVRKARPGVPSHLHTGIDFRRPSDNYDDEPEYPASRGVVISLRSDGPFAQIIVEHRLNDSVKVWTVYEHIAGIMATLGDTVSPDKPMGRFMTKKELDKYGWQFDHLHFEVMKKSPVVLKPERRNPFRRFNTYALTCYTKKELDKVYYDPREFLKSIWRRASLSDDDKMK
ncbi:MAG TPA: M23 family metallopeptidase [Chitinivibrionales bacterium]|nr:M23 family metallopeptidase [Chitinivibrionales bacterium]